MYCLVLLSSGWASQAQLNEMWIAITGDHDKMAPLTSVQIGKIRANLPLGTCRATRLSQMRQIRFSTALTMALGLSQVLLAQTWLSQPPPTGPVGGGRTDKDVAVGAMFGYCTSSVFVRCYGRIHGRCRGFGRTCLWPPSQARIEILAGHRHATHERRLMVGAQAVTVGSASWLGLARNTRVRRPLGRSDGRDTFRQHGRIH